MFHPLGVASPTIYKVEVFIGRLPSMIIRSFSSSQLEKAVVIANPVSAHMIDFSFMTVGFVDYPLLVVAGILFEIRVGI